MTALLLGGSLLLLAGGLVALRARMTVVAVTGLSMSPTLLPGDRVVVRRVPAAQIRRGDVIVLRVPGPCRPGDRSGERTTPWLVKRVAATPGAVPAAGILGVVIRKVGGAPVEAPANDSDTTEAH
jgi:signal peptidase I